VNEPVPHRTEAEVKRSWWPGWIWAAPLAALAVGGWLLLKALSQGGVSTTVTFDTVAGIKAGDTKVIFRGVQVGEVLSVKLAQGDRKVDVKLKLDKSLEHDIGPRARFWVIGAHPSLSRLDEIKDALTGAQIGVEPAPGQPQKHFDGLDQPPDEAPVGPQAPYLVRFEGPVGTLKPGAPVRLRGFVVGRVTSVSMRYDAGTGAIDTPTVIALEPQRFRIPMTKDWRAATDAMLRKLVSEGMRASLAQDPPLVGERSVELQFVPGAQPASLGAGSLPEIPAASTTDIKGLETKANQILAKVDAIPFQKIGENLRQISDHLNTLTGSPKLMRIISQVDDATEQLDKTVRQVGPQIQPIVMKLRQTADEADSTVAAAKKVIAGDPASQDSDVPAVLHQVGEAARSLRVLADELERHPEALVKGKAKPKETP
jgi:paraquat-inducible protein B